MAEVAIGTEGIKLAQFLKWAGVARTGGEARSLIAAGEVTVNGRRELRAGRRLGAGDKVKVGIGETFTIIRRVGED
ncbi:MAG: RNA-binding S4 domain-containing protein [Bacteroidota bacterium]